MARTDPQVNVRIKEDVLDRLKAFADANGRSMTEELNVILAASLPVSTRTVKLTLAIPSHLHGKLKTAAAGADRRVKDEILHRLEGSFGE